MLGPLHYGAVRDMQAERGDIAKWFPSPSFKEIGDISVIIHHESSRICAVFDGVPQGQSGGSSEWDKCYAGAPSWARSLVRKRAKRLNKSDVMSVSAEVIHDQETVQWVGFCIDGRWCAIWIK